MNVHFSFKHNVEKTKDLDTLINRRVDKFGKLLGTFNPDMVHFHGALEFKTPREGYVTSLNLRLPVGQMHSTHAARTPAESLRAAFDDLERQINKEKGLLRGDGHNARVEVETGEAEARVPKQKIEKPKDRPLSLT